MNSKVTGITSTTGKSATNYSEYSATTIHFWAGLLDGHLSKEQIARRSNDDIELRKRIQTTQVLIIDELGLLSASTFEKLEYVCRTVRNQENYFGGIQVIGAGDFRQLMPVPDHLYGDDGSPCYQWPNFRDVFPHHVNLNKVREDKGKCQQ